MKKTYILLLIANFIMICGVSAQGIVLKEGLYYAENGSLFTGAYTSDSFENGNKKIVFDIADGKALGTVTYYYENGMVMETGTLIGREKNGKWIRWDEAGHKTAEAFYVSGKKNGLWLIWDSMGTKRYEMTYKMGDKVGTWFMYDETGKLASEKNYNPL